MFSFFLLSALGVGLMVSAFDGSNGAEGDETQNADKDTDGLPEDPDAGNQLLEAVAHNETLNGGSGEDTISSFVNENVSLHGGDGDDTIIFQPVGHDGTDESIIDGGAGNDIIDAFGTGGGVIEGGDHNDTIRVQGTFTSVSGGEGDDTIIGDSTDSGGAPPSSAMLVTTYC